MVDAGDYGGVRGRDRNPKRLKAAAYAYADGDGPAPLEILTLGYIDRFGAQATLNRAYIGYGEIQRMLYAENLVKAYRSRAASADWARWAADNRQASQELNEAMRLWQTYKSQ